MAVFSEATLSKKKQILKQQVVPNKILIPWYQKAKAAIKIYFKNVRDHTPIYKAIDAIEKEAMPLKDWSKTNQQVSREALKKMMLIRLPRLLNNIEYEVVTVSARSIVIRGVEIKTAPEIIIMARINGDIVYGAVKIHISKSDPFNSQQAELVATVIYQFLKTKVAQPGEIVLPELCLCLDVFAGRIVGADKSHFPSIMDQVRSICREIIKLWAA